MPTRDIRERGGAREFRVQRTVRGRLLLRARLHDPYTVHYFYVPRGELLRAWDGRGDAVPRRVLWLCCGAHEQYVHRVVHRGVLVPYGVHQQRRAAQRRHVRVRQVLRGRQHRTPAVCCGNSWRHERNLLRTYMRRRLLARVLLRDGVRVAAGVHAGDVPRWLVVRPREFAGGPTVRGGLLWRHDGLVGARLLRTVHARVLLSRGVVVAHVLHGRDVPRRILVQRDGTGYRGAALRGWLLRRDARADDADVQRPLHTGVRVRGGVHLANAVPGRGLPRVILLRAREHRCAAVSRGRVRECRRPVDACV